MILQLDFSGEIPIYLQIRNQIVLGIANGSLPHGEKLPAIRTLADECGVNMMTVNKAYQQLKSEGYITTDRRNGATVTGANVRGELTESAKAALKLLISEAKLTGMNKEDFLNFCGGVYDQLEE
jgi:GntR family transcriptional regulator